MRDETQSELPQVTEEEMNLLGHGLDSYNNNFTSLKNQTEKR
jgi:hypothetical protein